PPVRDRPNGSAGGDGGRAASAPRSAHGAGKAYRQASGVGKRGESAPGNEEGRSSRGRCGEACDPPFWAAAVGVGRRFSEVCGSVAQESDRRNWEPFRISR